MRDKEIDMPEKIGFIGLGVMGEPICRNLARKSGKPVVGFDLADAPLQRLAEAGVMRAASPAQLAEQCDVDLSGAAERQACRGGLRRTGRAAGACRGASHHCRSRHICGRSDACAGHALCGEGRRLRRCADCPHPAGGGGGDAERHGRRERSDIRKAQAADRDLRDRHHPLRSGRRRDRWSKFSTTWC